MEEEELGVDLEVALPGGGLHPPGAHDHGEHADRLELQQRGGVGATRRTAASRSYAPHAHNDHNKTSIRHLYK